jgi:hypothetical protein
LIGIAVASRLPFQLVSRLLVTMYLVKVDAAAAEGNDTA